MYLKFLGGAREVGRSGVLFDTGKERVLFDYGIKIVNSEGPIKEPQLPMKVNLNLDAVLLSHAHLDHSGFVPNLYHRGYRGPLYTTATTLDLSRILLKDSIKIARIKNYPEHFNAKDMKEMEKNEFRITYGQYFHVGRLGVGVYDAGHIPGSVMFHVDAEDKKLVYSGDIKVNDTELLRGLEPIRENTDVLMVESTYGERDHPPREDQEKKLAEVVKETLENEGIALLACFAVGRAQEVLLILKKFGLDKYPIYLDGMAIDVTKIILKYPELIKHPKQLKKMYHKVTKIHKNKERDKIIKEPGIIVTTSGMLNGGPVVHYLEKLHDNENCSLVLTGFQVPGSAGRILLDTGKFVTEENEFKVNCKTHFIDLSAHAGREELLKYIKSVDPKKVLVMHGDQCEKFSQELKDMGYDSYAPKRGEKVEI